MKAKLKLVIFAMLLVCSLFCFLACGQEAVSYQAAGSVTIDGVAIEGAEVSCNGVTKTTDAEGGFTFNNLTGQNTVTVKDRQSVYFATKTIKVFGEEAEISFSGYTYYDIKGVVASNGEPVFGATVSVSGVINKSTSTNIYGEFEIAGIVGSATLSARKGQVEFFGQDIDRNTENKDSIVINATCDVAGEVLDNEDNVLEGVTVTDGTKKAVSDASGRYLLQGVFAKSKLTASKSGYVFTDSKLATTEAVDINFSGYKVLSKTGSITSGGIAVSGVTVKAVGIEQCNKGVSFASAVTDKDGRYILNGVYGEVEIVPESSKYNFENKNGVDFNAYFTVKGVVKLNGESLCLAKDMKIGERIVETNAVGVFTIEDATLSDSFDLQSDEYYSQKQEGELLKKIKQINYSLTEYYDITINVLNGNKGVGGVKADLGGVEKFTDSNGVAVFEKVYGSNVVTLSSNDYALSSQSLNFDRQNNSASINAQKKYSLNGVVKSAGRAVNGATIVINGKTVATTDADGAFSLTNLVGQVNFDVKKSGYIPTSCEVDENTTSLNNYAVELTYSDEFADIVGTVTLDGAGLAGVTITAGEITAVTDNDGNYTLVMANIYEDISASKQGYILFANGNNFEAYELYDVTVVVTSGLDSIDAQLTVINNKGINITASSEGGSYTFQNVYGVCEVSISSDNYIFDTNSQAEINCAQQVEFNGYFTLKGKIVGATGETFASTFGDIVADENGEFTIDKLYESDDLAISNDAYNISYSVAVDGYNKVATYTCDKLYNVSGVVINNGAPIANALVTLNSLSNTLTAITNENGEFEIAGAYGSYAATVQIDGYKTANFEVDIQTANAPIEVPVSKYYQTVVVAKNGENVLTNAYITFNGQMFNANAMGEIIVTDLFDDCNVTLSCDGYVDKQITLKEGMEQIDCDMFYTVKGVAKSGSSAVSGADITINGEVIAVTDSNGYFSADITGENILTISKDGYECIQNDIAVSVACEVEFNCTYTVSGYALNDGEGVANIPMFIIFEDFTSTVVYTDANGFFKVDGLTGTVNIKPNMTANGKPEGSLNKEFKPALITTSGCDNTLSFEEGAYSISGSVKTGGIAIAGVKLVAGNEVVYTDENGEYTFPKLKGTQELRVSKEGYNFGSTRIITALDEKQSVDIEATYSVSGYAESGNIKLVGTEIFVNGVSTGIFASVTGAFTVSGLSGRSEITFVKDGYNFAPIELTQPDGGLQAIGEYNFCGVIKTGNVAVEGVDIYINGVVVATTSADGTFTLENITGVKEISFRKNGYTFNESVMVNAPNSTDTARQIDCSYKVNGVAKTGEIILGGVSIFMNGEEAIKTNADGTFEISGLTGENTFVFELENYSFATAVSVNGYEQIQIQATYSISGKVETAGIAIGGVTILINGNNVGVTGSDGTFTIDGLSGISSLVFDKEGYNFGREIEINAPNLQMAVNATYSIYGKITTGNVAVSGVSVSNGTSAVKTDENGNFVLSGLSGENTLTYTLSGYEFNGKTQFNASETIIIDSVYSYSLITKNDSGFIGDVEVLLNGTLVGKTDANGYLAINGLSGANSISFRHNSYEFSIINISSPSVNAEQFATYTVKGAVLTGGVAVSGVEISRDNRVVATTNGRGEWEVAGLRGESALVFAKDGYAFDASYTFDGKRDDVVVQTTYAFKGTVVSGKLGVGEVDILINGVKCGSTSMSGAFEINGLSGVSSYEFAKQGYEFSRKGEISAYTANMNVTSTYSITIFAVNNGAPMQGVAVEIGGYQAVTGVNGECEFSGLSGELNLTMFKMGYSFGDNLKINKAGKFDFNATYSANGTITTGGEPVGGVTVTCGNRSTLSASDGSWLLSGLNGNSVIKFEKANYTFSKNTEQVSDYTENIESTCTYSITGKIRNSDNGSAMSGVSIAYSIGGKGYSVTTDANGLFVISNVAGVARITTIEKPGYIFSNYADCSKYTDEKYDSFKETYGKTMIDIDQTTVIDLGAINISTYYVKGRVSFQNVGISGVTVSAGGKTTVTDQNGNYEIKKFDKTVNPSVTITASKSNSDYSLTIDSTSASPSISSKPGEAVVKNLLVTANNNAYTCLILQGYDFMLSADTYESKILDGYVEGKKSVNLGPSANQNFRYYKSKDSSGKISYEYVNYGATVNILGIYVEPKIAFKYNYNLNNKDSVYYEFANNGSASNSSVVPNYSDATKKTVNGATFQTEFFIPHTSPSKYIIKNSTINSISNVSTVGGGVMFKVSYKTSGSKDSNAYIGTAAEHLQRQMKKFSGQDVELKTIDVTYTVNSKGYFELITTYENYYGSNSMGGADCKSNSTEKFRIVKNGVTVANTL